VGFIADGSILPRKSGTSDEPMGKGEAVVLHAPESLRVSVELPRFQRQTQAGARHRQQALWRPSRWTHEFCSWMKTPVRQTS
jgi:hypothetical protein